MTELWRILPVFCAAASFAATTSFMPLQEVRPGMRGTGRTVFSGTAVEEFQFEVLGVLENLGPRQSLVLARLSGGPIERTGVMQGMSGSPVYIGGRLLGAVAMAFPFSKEPIAGIRPIDEMVAVLSQPLKPEVAKPATGAALGQVRSLAALLPTPEAPIHAGGAQLVDIATPLNFGGFTRNAVEFFAPHLRSFGLEPRQGPTIGGNPAGRFGNPADLEPGSMISVQLMAGDLSIGADGTVTHIDANRVYAFGHRFLSIGAAELPFARAEVVTLLPSLNTSFKISAAREWMGAMTVDRNTAIAGELGRHPQLVPVSITVDGGPGSATRTYAMRMVNERFLSPLLLQMAVFSALDATERNLGASTIRIRGQVEFVDAPPLRIDNAFTGEFSVPGQVSMGAASPVAYAMQTGFSQLRLKSVNMTLSAREQKRQAYIDRVWASRNTVKPGEMLDITILLRHEGGAESSHKVSYAVPVGAPLGPLYITAADATTVNATDYLQFLTAPPRSPEQAVSFLNGLRDNTRAYVRLWRADPVFQVRGDDLPAPPPSVSMILGRTPTGGVNPTVQRNAKVADFDAKAPGDTVVSGNKTIQVEVKE